jgi:hypothetical protein
VHPGGTACRVRTADPAMTHIGDLKYTRPVCPACACACMRSARREYKRCVFLGYFVLGRILQRVLLLVCTRCDRLAAAAAKGRVVGVAFGSVWRGNGDQGSGTEVGTEIGRNGGRRGELCNEGLGIG